MPIVRAHRVIGGKPVEAVPKTIAEKAADVVERKLDQLANWKAGCGDCRRARQAVTTAAKETLRKVVPKR